MISCRICLLLPGHIFCAAASTLGSSSRPPAISYAIESSIASPPMSAFMSLPASLSILSKSISTPCVLQKCYCSREFPPCLPLLTDSSSDPDPFGQCTCTPVHHRAHSHARHEQPWPRPWMHRTHR